MLYREVARVKYTLPARGEPVLVIKPLRPIRARRNIEREQEPKADPARLGAKERRPADEARPATVGGRDLASTARPRPGIDDSPYNHSLIRLHELYLLGHWSQYDRCRLLAFLRSA